MQLFSRIPRLIRWILSVSLVFLLFMTCYRIAFFLKYNPAGKPFSGSAFLMGLRFDVKFTGMLAMAMLILSAFPFLNPMKRQWASAIWKPLLTLVFLAVMLFYVADFYYYDYLQQRLNAAILNYTADAAISSSMVWQSYPVIRVLFIVLIIAAGAWFLFGYLVHRFQTAFTVSERKGIGWYVLFFLLTGIGIFGKLGQFPLRWSDAFTLSDTFKANLSLNPFQSFFSTLNYISIKPDEKKTREAYPLIAEFLGLPDRDSSSLNYDRIYKFDEVKADRPNVVLVICESFSMYKSSMSGNPLDATPFFNSLVKDGIFYERCFTPSYPTARGVWATITSIPDVLGANSKTASRNPEMVSQHVIMNDFKGYEKFYFLGGDPTWANIKGMLLNNIDSLHLYSQENFKASKLNVWGIDDKNLFLEANQLLAKQNKPFFAVIQTADNHRPYTIPDEDMGHFQNVDHPFDTLSKYGFESLKQYNAFRYTDFCYQEFFEAARKEKYFNNTVFVFVGDHGIPGSAGAVYPKAWVEQNLAQEHVPLLFYAPSLLKPKTISTVCSQLDIMPTLANLLKVNHRNHAMGRNLFDSIPPSRQAAFIIDHEMKTIGMVTNDYYYRKNLKSGKVELVSVTGNLPVPFNPQTDSTRQYLDRLAEAYYETSKYLLYHNKK